MTAKSEGAMSEPGSVSELIERLQSQDSNAEREIWERLIERLINAANRRLRNLPRRVADEEDVAIAAFNAFFAGVREGRFRRLNNRDDLWQILSMLVERQAIGVMRNQLAEKRGGGYVRGESVFENVLAGNSARAGIDQIADPGPSILDGLAIEVREMLDDLDDDVQRRIAMMRLAGHTNGEIARELNIAVRSVERKLQLIRRQILAKANRSVRHESPSDGAPIAAIYQAAFGRADEGRIVERIRRQCPEALSLVASEGERVVGHLLFSPVTIRSNGGDTLSGFGLGPMAVVPARQRRGIGSMLVGQGLRELAGRGCPYVVVLGHPAYYPRFGFESASRHGLICQWPGVPDEAFMIFVIDPPVIEGLKGQVVYRPEFER